MPNRDVHEVAGVLAGALAAYHFGKVETPQQLAFEVAGGAIGGYWGAKLPDVFDPPTCPNHRHFAHGCVSCSLAIWAAYESLLSLQNFLRAEADRLAFERQQATDGVLIVLSIAAEASLRIAVGAIAGVVAGYASHLALDAFTPKGLPLICRGC